MLTAKILVGALLALGSALAHSNIRTSVQTNRNKYIVELESPSGVSTSRSPSDTVGDVPFGL
jgi:hypothetical protein